MNADRLLAHYERIADAPDAIPRLRRFVLDLAVRGKLVPQEPSDEAAPELLTRLTKGVSHPARNGEPRVDEHVQPYPLPCTWCWVRIGHHLELVNGMAFKPSDWLSNGLKIVRIQNLNRADAPFNYCDPKPVRDRFVIDDGAFLISWSGTPGTSFGAFIWDRGPAVLNQHIFRCDFRLKAFKPQYLRLAINGRLDEMIAKAHGGVGLQHITKGKLEALLIALPPLREQQRIVAKVDELMALCDRLELARMHRETTRDRLAAAGLARVNVPVSDPTKIHAHCRFLLDNLAALTTRADQLNQLRQTILNLAVRGRLVPQYPNDEPASELLKRVHADKVLSHPRRNERIDQNDVPFVSPPGWLWVSVQDILESKREISYGVIKLGDEPLTGGVPTLRCSDVKPGYLDLGAVRKVSEDIEGEYARTRLAGGEIVINIRGTLGGVALVPSSLAGFNVAREVAVVPVSEKLVGRFLVYVMRSPYFSEATLESLRGIAYKGLNLGTLRLFPIPLPPITEQRRIVAKVDELLALCDDLAASLVSSDDTRRRFFEALLAEALQPDARGTPNEPERIAARA